MDYTKSDSGSDLDFLLSGAFGFADNPKVRMLISELESSASNTITLDVSELTHIDSAGLGMMVLINDAAGDAGKNLSVKGATGQVKKLLEISKFDQMMTVID